MAETRVYISFDFDHDDDLKTLLIGQSKNEDSPFEIADWSIKEAVTGDWKAKARERIRAVDVVAVICGRYTDTATGVTAEVTVAQEEKIPYFLLAGRADGGNKKPTSAKSSDKLYKWAWDNLKTLIRGGR
jgi:antiphage defense system Thoeris ThsB-like protein